MKSRIWMMGIGMFLALGAMCPSPAATYYVDDGSNDGDVWTPSSSGNDANNGLTPATPKATLANLIGSVSLAAGDVVYIDTGSYAPTVISNTVNGAAGNPITFQGSTNSAAGGTVFTGSGYIFSVRGLYLRFQDIQVSGGSSGVVLTGAAYCEFIRVNVVGQANWSLRWENASNSNAFRRCVFKSIQSIIANAGTCRGNYLEHCVAISVNEGAISPVAGAMSNMVNCIVLGKYAFFSSTAMPERGSRNVFYTTDGILPTAETMADLHRMSTNWYGNIHANPKLLNADSLDFHLLSAAGYLSNGTWQTSTEHSPAIDFGAAGAAVGTEPDPNGGRINAGVHGGTGEASKSRTNAWTLAMTFNDGGSLIQTGRLEWVASTNLAGTDVALEYSTNQWATTNAIATVPATNEAHLWVPGFSHPAVQWRVRDPASGFASTNAKPFSIRATTNAVFSFYVNDGSSANDVYCSGLGDDGNLGIATNAPKRSLQAILNAYDLDGGDVVYVDTGDYPTNVSTVATAFDSGAARLPGAGRTDTATGSPAGGRRRAGRGSRPGPAVRRTRPRPPDSRRRPNPNPAGSTPSCVALVRVRKAEPLADDVEGPVLHLVEDAAEIEAEDAEVGQQDAAEEPEGDHHAGPARHGNPAQEILHDVEQGHEEGAEGQQEAGGDGQVERLVGLGDDAFRRQAEQLGEGVGRLAGEPLGVGHVDVPDGEAQPLDEEGERAVVLPQPQELLDHRAARDAEIGDGVVEAGVGEIVVDRVEAAGRGALEEGIPALDPAAENHLVVAGEGGLVQLRDLLGLVLEVAVHDDDPFAGGVLEAGGDGVVLSEVAGEADALAAGFGGDDPGHGLPGAVGAGVLHHDDLEVGRDRSEGGDEPPAEFVETGFGHVHGRDHGDLRTLHAHAHVVQGNGAGIKEIQVLRAARPAGRPAGARPRRPAAAPFPD